MQKDITVNGKTYTVKEITYLEALELDGLSKVEMSKKLLLFSSGISEEDLKQLSLSDGMNLHKAVNEVNNFAGIEDFQKPRE